MFHFANRLVNSQGKYMLDIDTPKETPHEPVELYDCVDGAIYILSVMKIDKSPVSPEEKEFLRLAAGRHLEFNYSAIATYYEQASDEMKRLMRQSGLVCLTFDEALESDMLPHNKRIDEAIALRKEANNER